MNPLLAYVLLLKASLTSFSGLAGVPVVHSDFVQSRHVITDAQLNSAIAVGRTVPGPNGLYIVCVGYYAAGVPGAIAGTFALMTPAFLIIPMIVWASRYAENRRVASAINAALIAGAGLLVAITFELARSAITGAFPAAVAVMSFAVMAATSVDTLWVMIAAAAAGLVAKWGSAWFTAG